MPLFIRKRLAAVLGLITSVVASPSSAACMDHPQWQGLPLTADFIDQVSNSENDAFRRAALQTLLLSKIEARKASVLKRAIPQALLKTKDNRARIRKTLRGGDLRQLPELLLRPPVNRNHARDMAEIYWLHGCPDEAMHMMQAPTFFSAFVAVGLIAGKDAQRLRDIAGHPEMWKYQAQRFLTLADLLDGLNSPQKTLSNYRDFLIDYQKKEKRPNSPSDLVAVQYSLAVIMKSPDRHPPPRLSSGLDDIAFANAVQAWKSIGTFFALIGGCEQTQRMRRVMLSLPSDRPDIYWRPEVEAVDVYCQMEAAAGQRNQ